MRANKLVPLVLVIILLLGTQNCQQDDSANLEIKSAQSQKVATAKTVSASDIPKVMHFLRSKTNDRLEITLSENAINQFGQHSHEEDLIVSTVLQDQIKQVTNGFGRSNYTFQLIEEETKEGDYFLNLVVKEHKDSFYMYITKYVPEADWLLTYEQPYDFTSFVGSIYYYDDGGRYLGYMEADNGIMSSLNRNPCPGSGDGAGGNNNGGGAGSSDGATGDSGIDSGSGLSDGGGDPSNGDGPRGGGGGIMVVIPCPCAGHTLDDHCDCPIQPQVVVIPSKSANDYLENPCPPGDTDDDCGTANDCEYGWDNNCECLDEPDEVGEVGVNITPIDYSIVFDNLGAYLSNNQVSLLNSYEFTWLRIQLKSILDDYVGTYGEINSEAIIASMVTIRSALAGTMYGPYDSNYAELINPFFEAELTSDPTMQGFMAYFSAKCAILRAQNPEWSDTKIYWEASREMVHLALDIAGLVPVIGEVCDIANGVIYAIEGDGLNATLSISAAIPIGGWFVTGAKYAYKGSLKFIVKANGIISFGNRSKLRKVLGLTDSGMHAHHLIPWTLKEHSLVQKAAKAENAFHMNEALNGIPRATSLHLTGHSTYNLKIEEVLINLYDETMTVSDAYDELFDFIHYLRNLIETNPTLNSGQIANLINYP